MFRLWGKEFKDNRMVRDTVICDDTDDTRTHKIFNALDAICYEFDLSKPICWMQRLMNSNDMTRRGLHRITSWTLLTLITSKSTLLKNKPLTPYSLRIAARGLSFMARRAGKYPAITPTSIAKPIESSTSHGGI